MLSGWTNQFRGGTPTPTPAPSWSVNPSISGVAQVGQTLTGSDGTISNGTVSGRQWKRDGVNISGATATTYLLTTSDLDALITYQVTASGTGGSASATSSVVGPVIAAAPAPVISKTGNTFSNDNGDSGQWYRDGVAISGQTGSTYTYVEANDLGRAITQVVGGQSSNAIVETAVASAIIYDFNQANGTKLSAYPGQPMTMLGGNTTEQDKYTCQSNKGNVATLANSFPQAMAVRNVGTNHEVAFKIDGSPPPHIAACSDASNFMFTIVNDSGAGRWLVYSNIGGTEANRTNNGIQVPGSLNTGKLVTLAIKNGKWQFRVDGLPYAIAPSFGGNSVQTDVWYDLPAGFVAGPYAGFKGAQWGPFTCDDLSLLPLDNAININSATVVELLDGSGDPYYAIRLVGTAQANVLNAAEVLLLDDVGNILSNWSARSGAPGSGTDFTIDSQAVPQSVLGTDVQIVLRDTTTKSTAARIATTLPYLQPYEPMTKGINEGYTPEWGASAGEKNLVRMGSFRYTDTYNPYCTPEEIGAETDGKIRNWPAGHSAGIRQMLPAFAPVGYYTGTYPAGMTLGFQSLSGYTVTQAPSGGTFELQATQATGKAGNTILTGTIPSGGAEVTILPKADPHPERPYYEDTAANYASLGVTAARFMTPLGANGNETYPTSQIYIPGAGAGSATLSIAYIVSLCNALSMDCYLAIPHWWTETRARAIAAYIRANLNSGLKVVVEHSNEVFNESNGFWGQVRYHQIEGCRAGLYNTNGDAGPQTIAITGIDTSNGHPTTTFNTGDMVFSTLNGFGAGVWKAKKAISVGATDKIETTTNTAWELIANNNDVTVAKWRYYSHKSRALHDIFLEEFVGQEHRVERVVCGQSGSALGALEIVLSWNDLAEHIDRVMVAPYFGYNMSSYTDGHFTGWGATEKALVYTNPAAWRDAYFAAVPGVISSMITQMQNWRTYTGQWLFANYGRAVADHVKTGSYECGPHFDPMGRGNWPDTSTVVEPEYRNLMQDARWGTTIQPYYEAQRANGGAHYQFDRIGGTWGLSRNELDVTGTPHVAYANFDPLL